MKCIFCEKEFQRLAISWDIIPMLIRIINKKQNTRILKELRKPSSVNIKKEQPNSHVILFLYHVRHLNKKNISQSQSLVLVFLVLGVIIYFF